MRVRETVSSELRAAWRGVRARGWRAPLIVGLVAVPLAAAAVVFSAADSFVLGRLPYPNADRLVVLQRTVRFTGSIDYLWPEAVREWRNHPDLFSSVQAHDTEAPLYLTIGDLTETVLCQRVTPGVFEALGVMPRWGRSLLPGDERPDRPPVAVIAEDLARRVFADPSPRSARPWRRQPSLSSSLASCPRPSGSQARANACGALSISRASRPTSVSEVCSSSRQVWITQQSLGPSASAMIRWRPWSRHQAVEIGPPWHL